MNDNHLEKLTHALLYEGYLLYPYRLSALKNRQRFNFGLLVPQNLNASRDSSERSFMQTECLVVGGKEIIIDLKARFLQLIARDVCRTDLQVVDRLQIGEEIFETCQQAIEQEIALPPLQLNVTNSGRQDYSFSAQEKRIPLIDADGQPAGFIIEKKPALAAAIEIDCQPLADRLSRITARIINQTALAIAEQLGHDELLLYSLVSTHAILRARNGEFISLLDPPDCFREAASACNNIGCWPVLVGENFEKDLMLSSPIILYDYPQIAAASAGDLFDATEIDEILTLRILTLTDAEKSEMRRADARVGAMLARVENISADQLMRMHGIMRNLRKQEER